jgi:hypothetical protein
MPNKVSDRHGWGAANAAGTMDVDFPSGGDYLFNKSDAGIQVFYRRGVIVDGWQVAILTNKQIVGGIIIFNPHIDHACNTQASQMPFAPLSILRPNVYLAGDTTILCHRNTGQFG